MESAMEQKDFRLMGTWEHEITGRRILAKSLRRNRDETITEIK